MQYRLTCKCGRAYPVETGQAGGTISCECGETIQIPTMMKIKRLPEWDEGAESEPEEGAQENSKAPETADAEKKTDAKPKKERLSSKRKGLFIVAGLFFVVSVFFFTFIISHKPDPRMVFYKQINYKLEDGRNIKRDSTPILEEDFGFYYLQDPYTNQTYEMNDFSIEHLTDFYAYQYFNYLKKLDLSDNFYENYDAVLTKWRLWVIAWGVVALASLVGAMCALFIKESDKQVGVMRGEGWK